MDKAVIAFLNRGSFDPQDLIAKRAIRACIGLKGLLTNADDRGQLAALADVDNGINCAIYAFACINTEKRYDFADQVHSTVAGLTEALLDLHKPADKALGLLEQAEIRVRRWRDILTPVCTVRGCTSVQILRGDYCRMELANMRPVNDN